MNGRDIGAQYVERRAVEPVLQLLPKPDDVDALVEPWRDGDDGDHLGKDATSLEACAGHAVALAAGLRLWARQGTQRQGGSELCFAVLPRY